MDIYRHQGLAFEYQILNQCHCPGNYYFGGTLVVMPKTEKHLWGAFLERSKFLDQGVFYCGQDLLSGHGLFASSDLVQAGLAGLHFDFTFLGYLAFLCQFIGHNKAGVTISDTLCLQILQCLDFGHCLGQFHQVDVSAACLVQDLDASHQVVSKASLDSTVRVFSSTSHGKSLFVCHKVAFQIAYQVTKNATLLAQHINIIAKDCILVNHFCYNFDSFLPVLSGQFLTGFLDGLDTTIKDTSNTREAHSGHDQTQYKTNDQVAHYNTFT
jgi:hypothetical protein